MYRACNYKELMYLLDVVAIRVGLTAESHRTVEVKKLLEKRRTRQPHPSTSVHTPVCIQEQLVEHLNTSISH